MVDGVLAAFAPTTYIHTAGVFFFFVFFLVFELSPSQVVRRESSLCGVFRVSACCGGVNEVQGTGVGWFGCSVLSPQQRTEESVGLVYTAVPCGHKCLQLRNQSVWRVLDGTSKCRGSTTKPGRFRRRGCATKAEVSRMSHQGGGGVTVVNCKWERNY